MEGASTDNWRIFFKFLFSYVLIATSCCGFVAAGGYRGYGGPSGAAASNVASTNSWSGGNYANTNGYQGNPFLSGTSDKEPNLSDDLTEIVGLLSEVLDDAKKINKNLHGASQIGCKSDNCGQGALNTGKNPGYSQGNSYPSASTSANANGGASAGYGTGYGSRNPIHNPLPCSGPACSGSPTGYKPTHGSYPSPSAPYQPSCGGPECKETHYSPPQTARQTQSPQHEKFISSSDHPSQREILHFSKLEKNCRDASCPEINFERIRQTTNFPQKLSHEQDETSSQKPPINSSFENLTYCNGRDCNNHEKRKTPQKLTSHVSHHYNSYQHRNSQYPSPEIRPPCNGPACTENDRDKNPLELGSSDFSPTYPYQNDESYHHHNPQYPSPEYRPPCNGPACTENDRDKNPLELGSSDFSPSYPYQNDESYPHHNPEYPSPEYRPPCNGPACTENDRDKNPLELGSSDFSPSYPSQNDESYQHSASRYYPPHHSPDCFEKNYHFHSHEQETSRPAQASNSYQFPSSDYSDLCQNSDCRKKNVNFNPLSTVYPPKHVDNRPHSPPQHELPNNEPWHPVLNPQGALGCIGTNCGDRRPESPSYNLPSHQARPPTISTCSGPNCNPYSSTGCPGPYCEGPEYSKPECSGSECAQNLRPRPVCSGPNCGNPYSTTGCPGPYCDGPEYSKPCAGSKCGNGFNSNKGQPGCTGPHCGGGERPDNHQNTGCPGPQCNGVIPVRPQKPTSYRPAQPACTSGNCQPHSGSTIPGTHPQKDYVGYVSPAFNKPNIAQGVGYGGPSIGCAAGGCGGNKVPIIGYSGPGSFSSSSSASSSYANAASYAYGGGSKSFASASASASAYSNSYGR